MIELYIHVFFFVFSLLYNSKKKKFHVRSFQSVSILLKLLATVCQLVVSSLSYCDLLHKDFSVRGYELLEEAAQKIPESAILPFIDLLVSLFPIITSG